MSFCERISQEFRRVIEMAIEIRKKDDESVKKLIKLYNALRGMFHDKELSVAEISKFRIINVTKQQLKVTGDDLLINIRLMNDETLMPFINELANSVETKLATQAVSETSDSDED